MSSEWHHVCSSFHCSLTETTDGLQALMEDLQAQVDELKAAQAERNRREGSEQRRNLGAQSVSCLKELYDLQHERFCLVFTFFIVVIVIKYHSYKKSEKCEIYIFP